MNKRLAIFAAILLSNFGVFGPAFSLAEQPTTLPTQAENVGNRVPEPAAIRADFLKLIDRPRVVLDPEVQAPITVQNRTEIRFSFASEAGQRVPGILVKRLSKSADTSDRLPVVIALHGTGGNKTDQLPFLRQLADRGFVGIAIDGRYHGERTRDVTAIAPMNVYETKIFQAFSGQSHEHPLYYDTVWDIMRLIDYLQTRDDINAGHIGIYGVSKGGIEAYLATAVDTRIGAAVPTIGVQSFQWGLDHNDWQGRVGTFQKAFDAAAKGAGVDKPDAAFAKAFYDKVMPGMDGEFDGPSILPLIAPRPLFVVNSDNDNHTPIGGVTLTADAAKSAFLKAGVDDHFVLTIQHNAGHRVLPESEHAAIEFFGRWLVPTTK